MLFTNGIDWCTTMQLAPIESLKGQIAKPWTGAADPARPFGRQEPIADWRGSITGVDADTGAVRWKYQSPTPIVAGVTTTAGGLLFSGDLTGAALALDAASGQLLWRNDTGQPIGGGVVSYAANGRQRIAVAAGMKSVIWPVNADSARIIVYGLP